MTESTRWEFLPHGRGRRRSPAKRVTHLCREETSARPRAHRVVRECTPVFRPAKPEQIRLDDPPEWHQTTGYPSGFGHFSVPSVSKQPEDSRRFANEPIQQSHVLALARFHREGAPSSPESVRLTWLLFGLSSSDNQRPARGRPASELVVSGARVRRTAWLLQAGRHDS